MNFNDAKQSEFLEKATTIVLENLQNDQFGVSVMAREMGISRSSLHRRFTASCGDSASGYIRSVKLERAMKLLGESSARITEIALDCGYQSLAYFDKCFKEKYGSQPNKVRKDILEKVSSEPYNSNSRQDSTSIRTKNQLFNFPVQVTSFIGRQKEMTVIKDLINKHRLVSLVGAGGCGKTRLACEIVSLLETDFEDGIWFVDLAPVETGSLVAKEIIETLQIPELPGEDILETLVRKIREKNIFILLDNCEHVAEACTRVVAKLSQSVPRLTLLITSRLVLNCKGEKIWRIPSLSLIKPERLMKVAKAMDSEAVLLFADRARLSDHKFELTRDNVYEVATICNRLDGIPLALELVASRIRYMDPATMLERLSDRFSELSSSDRGVIERHKTLNATIDWSYKLLTNEEGILFKRLSVFSGGFDIPAVEEVCGDRSLPVEYMLDLLSSLVDRSMVETFRYPGHSIRFYLLETLRQYASDLLQENEKIRLRKRHLGYFSNMADRACEERLYAQAFWLGKLHLEHDNMITAMNWAEDHSIARYARLAGELTWFWTRSNNYTLARQIFEKILSNGYAVKEAKARVLAGYGWVLTSNYNEFSKAIETMEQSVSSWRRLNNKNEEALVLADLALFTYGIGDDDLAVRSASEAYKIAQIENDPGVLLYCMMPVSQGFVNLKRFDEARSMAGKILEIAEKQENLFAQFMGNHHIADCALMEGNYLESEKQYGKGLQITTSYGDMFYVFIELTGLAMSVAGQGRSEKALRIIATVKEAAKKMEMMFPEEIKMIFWQELVQKHLVRTREKLGKDLTEKYESLGRIMDLDEVIGYALDFEKD